MSTQYFVLSENENEAPREISRGEFNVMHRRMYDPDEQVLGPTQYIIFEGDTVLFVHQESKGIEASQALAVLDMFRKEEQEHRAAAEASWALLRQVQQFFAQE